MACGAEPHDPDAVFCDRCLPLLVPFAVPLCPSCALPAPCGGCSAQPWEAAGAAVPHGPEGSALAVAFKRSGVRRMARLMAGQMAAADSLPGIAANTAVVAVPPDPRRRRISGVDHAGLLAGALARELGRPVARPLLRKAAPRGVRQAGASRSSRLVAGRIEIHCRSRPARSCLIVDDVHTTGATLRATAEALRAGGAQRVACMTWARALDPGTSGRKAASW